MIYLKNNVKYYINKSWIKSAFSVFIFCFFLGSTLNNAIGEKLSLYEYVLLNFNNQYFMFFCFIPIYFIFLYSTLSKQQINIIIRQNKFIAYAFYEILTIGIISILYIAIHVLCAILIGKVGGLAISKNFSSSFNNELLLSAFYSFFNSGAVALIATCAYSLFGLILFACIVKFLYYYFGRKTVLLFTVFNYFISIVAIQKSIDETLPYLFFPNYMILPLSIYKGIPSIFVFLNIAIIMLIFLSYKYYWRYYEL